ncbi:hypothetical protein EV426DRAFT_539697, partial [Tirmania nivea]
YEKAFGVDNPPTLATVHSMASAFKKQGQSFKALECGMGGYWVGLRRHLGVDHPDSLTTLHSMAFIFESQGQYDKALEWYGRALAGYEKSIGSNHPNTQTTIRRLTDLHERVGQIEQAQGLRTRLYVPTIPNR